jgi:DNA-binding response OmpR family regulator
VAELVVRLQALLRRSTAPRATGPAALQLDPAGHAVHGPAGRQSLTPTEFRLLAALMAAAGDVVRRRELARAGWPDGAVVAENTLDQYVARLRRKLVEAGDHGRTITTVVGVGHRFQ